MTTANEILRSVTIAAEIEGAEQKQADLKERISQLTESIEELQDQLGRAMAGLGGTGSVTELRGALRDAQDERDACERGLEYLSEELERLAADRRAALGREAKEESDRALELATDSVAKLAAETETCFARLPPLMEQAYSATAASIAADSTAASLAGGRLPSTHRAQSLVWSKYPGLESVIKEVRRYAAQSTQ